MVYEYKMINKYQINSVFACEMSLFYTQTTYKPNININNILANILSQVFN